MLTGSANARRRCGPSLPSSCALMPMSRRAAYVAVSTHRDESMARRKSPSPTPASRTAGRAAARNTDSGSAGGVPKGTGDRIAERAADVEATAEAMPFNANKPLEYGYDNAHAPQEGEGVEPPSDDVGASTLSEVNASDKPGTRAAAGEPVAVGPLDPVRTDATARRMTTNQGVPISDNQHSLKAGLRGPALLKDFVLREKITHFDHERIPERIVHARGSRRARLLRVLCATDRHHARGAVPGGRQDHAGIRAVLDRAGRTRFEGHRARRARLRGEVLHRRRQLGPGGQQHARCSSSRTR